MDNTEWHQKYESEIQAYNYKHYSSEIESLKKIIGTPRSDKFIMDMYIALVNGRKITPKMLQAIRKIILRNSPDFIRKINIEANRLIPKLNQIRHTLSKCGYTEHYVSNSEYFLDSVEKQVLRRGTLTLNQRKALNKMNKRFNKRIEHINNCSHPHRVDNKLAKK